MYVRGKFNLFTIIYSTSIGANMAGITSSLEVKPCFLTLYEQHPNSLFSLSSETIHVN